MKLQVMKPDAPVLRTVCTPLSKQELRQNNVQDIIEELLDFVYGDNNKGPTRDTSRVMTVGLSANQLGLAQQISVVDMAIGRKNLSDIHVFINPRIIWKSKASCVRTEGCVNLPNIWGPVKRSYRIKVAAMDRSGNEMEMTLTGWPAILFQHEVDHLEGKLFIDHLTDPTKAFLVKDNEYKLYKKQKKSWKKFIDVSALVKKVPVTAPK